MSELEAYTYYTGLYYIGEWCVVRYSARARNRGVCVVCVARSTRASRVWRALLTRAAFRFVFILFLILCAARHTDTTDRVP